MATEVHRKAAVPSTGDYEVSVILYATACESLIDELVQHLLWEQNKDPHEASQYFKTGKKQRPKGIVNLARTELYPLLGGTPANFDKEVAFNDWITHVTQLRNRIVHNSASPSPDEMRACREAVHRLVDFIKERLLWLRSNFPITTLALLGENGLVSTGEWDRFLKLEPTLDLVAERMRMFRRWSDLLAVYREKPWLLGSNASPDEGSAQVVFEDGVAIEAYAVHKSGAVATTVPLDQIREFDEFKLILENEGKAGTGILSSSWLGGFSLPKGARWTLKTHIDTPGMPIMFEDIGYPEF